MTDATYNGWTNYETWAVGMYLDGNYTGQYTYQATIETVEDALEGNSATEFSTVEQVCRREVADALRPFVETGCSGPEDEPTILHPLVSDLFGAALSAVNWYELADAWINNVREQVTS
jgi:hypothetical protein